MLIKKNCIYAGICSFEEEECIWYTDFAQCDMDDVTIPHECVLEKNIVYYVLCHQFQRGIDYCVVIRRIRSHSVKLTVSKLITWMGL